jgi:hypothetical protein
VCSITELMSQLFDDIAVLVHRGEMQRRVKPMHIND